MSSLYLPESSKPLPNGVRVCLTRADHSDQIHCVTVAQEVYRVIENDALFHGVKYDGKGFQKILDAFKQNRVQAYFLIVERESCLPAFAGGAIQFPSVITEWNGRNFEHYPATYSEDTWVDRTISDDIRKLTVSPEYPKGIGLGTLNTQGRIRLSTSGKIEDLPYGMVSKGRISENAVDNHAQLAILAKLGAHLKGGAIFQLNAATPINEHNAIDVSVHGLGAPAAGNGIVRVLPNVFLTAWSNSDGSQRVVGTHTEAISTTTGDTIVRSQFLSNGNLPAASETVGNILASMMAASRTEVCKRGWTAENEPGLDTSPIIRAHAHEKEIVTALTRLAEPRYFGEHLMAPVAINYASIPDHVLGAKLPLAKPLTVINSPYPSYATKQQTNGWPKADAIRASL